MHESIMEYVGQAVARHNLRSKRTLEIGSYDVNGSVREFFSNAAYIGVDREIGPGVDQVMFGADLAFEDASFEVVVSTSQLEHDPTFWLTLAEIKRVLRPGGYFILCTVGQQMFIHNRPDYYRFLPDTHKLLMELAGCEILDEREDPQTSGPQITGRRLDD